MKNLIIVKICECKVPINPIKKKTTSVIREKILTVI